MPFKKLSLKIEIAEVYVSSKVVIIIHQIILLNIYIVNKVLQTMNIYLSHHFKALI